jgi:hypothetical chaperone protein
MRVGLDFGTTNSSAALFDGSTLRLLALDPANADVAVMRSTLLVTRDGVPFIGREALDRFTTANVGREIEYEWKYLGDAEVTFSETGSVMQALYAKVDANQPGRLFQSLKTGLRDRTFRRTNVFGISYTLEELVAIVLRMLRARIENELGAPITEMVIGRPVRYAVDAAADALAFERMQAACRLAELPNVRFLEEPTAAALSYARDARPGEHLLVFDFGGGTLDVTILLVTADRQHRLLATAGVPIGGDLLDQRLVMGRLLGHFGEGATLGTRRLPLPTTLLEHLTEWQSIIDLTQPRYLAMIDEAIAIGDRPQQLRQLRELVRNNYGLPLFAAVERTKTALSSADRAEFVLQMTQSRITETIPRWDFERLIGPDVRAVEQAIDLALHQAGLTTADIDVVLRTGGSSRVPRFVRMLSEKFGAERLREMDVFTGVAAGLAIAAYDGPAAVRYG